MKKKRTVKYFFQLGSVLGYFFRKNTGRSTNFNLKAMNMINKLSAILFLLGLFYLLMQRLLR